MKIGHLFATALAALSLLGTACSDDEAPPADERAPECTLTPTTEVRTKLMESYLADPRSDQTNPLVTECTYSNGAIDAKVVIRYEVGVTGDDFAAEKKASDDSGQPTTDIKGLGDAAYTSSSKMFGSTFTTVAVRKGGRAVKIVSTATLEQIRTLMASILTRV